MGTIYVYSAIMLIYSLNVNLVTVSAGIINTTAKLSVKDDSNSTFKLNNESSQRTRTLSASPLTVTDSHVTSDSNQKPTRQIFTGSKEELPVEDDQFTPRSSSTKVTTDANSSGRKPSSEPDQFEDFHQDPRTFQFQDPSNFPRDPHNSGFADFRQDDQFSNARGSRPIAASFGSSRPPSASSTTRVTDTNLPTDDSTSFKDTNSGSHHNFPSEAQDEFFDPRLASRPRFTASSPSFQSRGRPQVEEFSDSGFDGRFNGGRHGGSFQENPSQHDNRFDRQRSTSLQTKPTNNFQTSHNDDHGDQIDDGSHGQTPPISSHSKPSIHSDNFDFQAPESQFDNFNDPTPHSDTGKGSHRPIAQHAPFDVNFHSPPSKEESRPTFQERHRPFTSSVTGSPDLNEETFNNHEQESPSRKPASPSSHDPNSKFRDSDQINFSQQQRFVPITRFNDGPFHEFGGFRPLEHNDDNGNFHSTSNRNHQPQQSFGSQFNNEEFSDADPTVFDQRGPSNEESSHFERPRPQHLNQPEEPEFDRPQSFEDQPRSQQSTETDGRHQGSPRSQQLHNDDTTHHHSSATNNILGSGNFGIIRGGIFADSDGIRQSHFPSTGRHSPFQTTNDDDFFSGFRDFQPFGGTLHNALSSQSQKIHDQPLRTAGAATQQSQGTSNNSQSSSAKFDTDNRNLTLTSNRG
ncbi:hypothetical protein CHUAL_008093 [Chamberlinius hualienensis]